ncbi:MAG: prolyl oligopeptidase family serine peptidase [Clostridia bacterium]|nr:prolyl oligopeptidase family serine peptidase [Clostridia bacterium]
MKRIVPLLIVFAFLFAACSHGESLKADTTTVTTNQTAAENTMNEITFGTKEYKGFMLDNIYHSEIGDIHFNLYIPDGYDESEKYALFVTLPGWEGLYFQGVGENLYNEDFGFEAQKYNDKMLIVAPQLNDWGETSADEAIALTEYFISHYSIDETKVYLNGYSGGGETLSIMLGKRPELFAKALHVSSKWDGDLFALAKAKTPLYIFIGEGDEYYGSEYVKNAYNELFRLYKQQGLNEKEINELLILDVKDQAYFTEHGMSNQHGGGNLAAFDETVMKWLFQ